MRVRPPEQPTSDILPDWLAGGPDLPRWSRLGTDAAPFGFSAAERAWDRAGDDWSRDNLGDQLAWRLLLAPEVAHRLSTRWRLFRRPYGEPWLPPDVDHDTAPTPEPEPDRLTLPPRVPVTGSGEPSISGTPPRRAPKPPDDPPSSGAYFIGERF